MNIAVCVKQEYDVTGSFRLREEAKEIDTYGLIPIINPADLSALALVRSALPKGSSIITAISVGPESIESVLRDCLAAGADEAIRIWDDRLSSAESGEMRARVLAAAVQKFGFDLVLCGSQSLCGGSGFVGPAMAEFLGYAQVSSVTKIDFTSGDARLSLSRRLEHGNREVLSCALPAVLTVDAGTAEPDYAGMPDIIAAQRASIAVVDYEDLEFTPPFYIFDESVLRGYIPPRPRTKRRVQPAKKLTRAQQMRQMTGAASSGKKGACVEGSPEEVAREILRLLRPAD